MVLASALPQAQLYNHGVSPFKAPAPFRYPSSGSFRVFSQHFRSLCSNNFHKVLDMLLHLQQPALYLLGILAKYLHHALWRRIFVYQKAIIPFLILLLLHFLQPFNNFGHFSSRRGDDLVKIVVKIVVEGLFTRTWRVSSFSYQCICHMWIMRSWTRCAQEMGLGEIFRSSSRAFWPEITSQRVNERKSHASIQATKCGNRSSP